MRFDFAISFAGPEREVARELTENLKRAGFSVFFDELFEHEMLGRDGADYLNDVFFSQSERCVALLSQTYEERAWAQLERRAAQARELGRGLGFLIPVLCDEVRPTWLLPTRIFFDLRGRGLPKLVDLLTRRALSHPGGGYRLIYGLSDIFGNDTIDLITVPEAHEFLVWSTFTPSPVQCPARLWKSSSWQTDPLPVPARGQYLFLFSDRMVVVPEHSTDPIQIFPHGTKVPREIRVPRKTKWTSVTDCKCSGQRLLISYCGGDVWVVDLTAATTVEVRSGSDDVVYATSDWLDGYRIAIGDDASLTMAIYDLPTGSIVETFDMKQPAMALGCLPGIGHVVVGGEGAIQIYDPVSRSIVHEHEVMHGVFYLSCAKEGGIYGFTTGFPASGNVLEVWDAKTGLRVLRERSDRQGGWLSFSLSDDSSLFAVRVGRNQIRVYERAL